MLIKRAGCDPEGVEAEIVSAEMKGVRGLKGRLVGVSPTSRLGGDCIPFVIQLDVARAGGERAVAAVAATA